MSALTLDNVYKASYVLKNVVRKTDVIYAPGLRPGTELYLKTENLQLTGSFKLRGAYYKMRSIKILGNKNNMNGVKKWRKQ